MQDLKLFPDTPLPAIAEREQAAINQLMADKKYRIKQSASFLRADKSDRVSSEFILYILNDYLGHIQRCVASTKKMVPAALDSPFYGKLARQEPVAAGVVAAVRDLDVRTLSQMLQSMQATPRDITVAALAPFTRLLFRSLIRVYYLGAAGLAQQYKAVYSFVHREIGVPRGDDLKRDTTNAIEEWYYIMDQVCPGLYPLVLRMCSPVMLTQNQLFYSNGSKVLAWLEVAPSEVLFQSGGKPEQAEAPVDDPDPEPPSEPAVEAIPLPPVEVQEGLEILERLFPEAGWDSLESMPDFCPYFQPILLFQDAFSQLAPENPLQLTIILLGVLEELFQALRLIKFEPLLEPGRDDPEDIQKILEEWILYQESLFDKVFSNDLKEFTHQLYTQPEYTKNPYGRKLLSNMYSLIKGVFLPYFDIRMYGTAKVQKDERLPPFFVRVARLKKLLVKYRDSIESAPGGADPNGEGSVPGVQNPWAPYKFDIPNSVSRRLDALCGGKHAKCKTNALLIQYTLSILQVLDWWINDRTSYAYRNAPDHLYRVIEPGSLVPAFGVKSRNDVDALFMRHIKTRLSGSTGGFVPLDPIG